MGRAKFSLEDGAFPTLYTHDRMPIDFVNEDEEVRMVASETELILRLNQPADSIQSDSILPANLVEDMYRDKPMPKAPKLRFQNGKRPASPPFLCMIGGTDECKRRKIQAGAENTREF
jgi:hypothetical protein